METTRTPSADRRVRRTDDLALALRYLLTSQRERAGLTHLVLATSEGMLLAWDGPRDDCEELAAYAPFIARGEGYALDPRRLVGLSVHPFDVRDDRLYLLLRGEQPAERVAAMILSSMEGVARILAR